MAFGESGLASPGGSRTPRLREQTKPLKFARANKTLNQPWVSGRDVGRLASPAGVEPTAPELGILCSIHLSYGDKASLGGYSTERACGNPHTLHKAVLTGRPLLSQFFGLFG